jgi:GNAT superfamily N-acetyltransferase
MLQIKSTYNTKLTEVEIKQLHEIIRIAYEKTEEEIWGKNYVRIFYEEFKALVNKGDFLVAFLNGEIVGGVQAYLRKEGVYSFSLLGVDFNHGGKGIGTALINEVEKEAESKGATQVDIEILRVRDVDVKHKLVLANYYERLGYRYTHSDDCSCIIPEWKYKLLVAPSDFDFYTKKL